MSDAPDTLSAVQTLPDLRSSLDSSTQNLAMLAIGLSLFLAGTASSIYLWTTRQGDAQRAAPAFASLPSTTILSRLRDVARASTTPSGSRPRAKPVRRPEAVRRAKKTLHPMQPLASAVRYQARSF